MVDDYGPADDAALPEIATLTSWSFGFAAADAEPWLRTGGVENLRVLRRGATIDACLLLIPHAQFFAGRSVPAMGVAAVATAADRRGTGAAVALLEAMLRELHARGVATSNLYPATLPLYRRVGYEIAGARYEVKAPITSLPRRDRALPLREMRAEERPALEASYREAAARTNGWLDRGPYVWGRVFAPRGEHARAFVVGEPGRIEGHAVFFERRGGAKDYSLVATDLVARTPAAIARLFTLFADHGTLADTVTWFGSPSDALVHALPSVDYAVRVQHTWMTRLVDVPKALVARGWPPGMSASVDLHVRDPLLSANDGRFVLAIEGGRASVERGGRGTFALDVRALAALYTGHMTPRALAIAGVLDAPEEDLPRAEAMFAVPAPSLVDFF